MPIYKMSMGEARCEAAFPGTFLPMLMIRGKCLHFRAKAAQVSGHLPTMGHCVTEVSYSPKINILIFSQR